MKINENKITLPLLNCWAAKYCPSLILRNARVIPQRKHVDPFNLEGRKDMWEQQQVKRNYLNYRTTIKR